MYLKMYMDVDMDMDMKRDNGYAYENVFGACGAQTGGAQTGQLVVLGDAAWSYNAT